MPDFPPANVPDDGRLLFITDELGSPADFYLHHLVHERLRSRQKVIILSTRGEDGGRWRAIAAKSAVNTTQAIAAKTLTFINLEPTAQALKEAYGSLQRLAEQSTLVILDDLSLLGWFGLSSLDLSRFVRAVVALCRNMRCRLVVRLHLLNTPSSVHPASPYEKQDEEETDDVLFRLLIQLCTTHIQVSKLTSGKSGSVSGQIAMGENRLQYCLTDFGVTYFDRGTGDAVL